MSRPEIVEDVIAAAAAVPQALDRLSEEARAAWAGQLAADVAAERRASGVTVAPEAALHLALQARTDELERVRADLTAEKAFSALVQRRLVEARAERDAAQSARDAARSAWTDLREAQATLQAAYDGLGAESEKTENACAAALRERDEARTELERVRAEHRAIEDKAEDDRRRRAQAVETMEHREAEREVIEAGLRQQIDTLTRERDEAQAALAEARAENASLRAVVPPGTHVARVEWGVHAEVTRQRDEILRLTRERDEARTKAATDGPAYNAGRSEGRADIAAELRAALDPDDVHHWNITGVIGHVRGLAQSLAIACDLGSVSPTPDGDAPTMTITATDPEDAARRVREYVSAYAPPTAPDVALPCAPAAGAADPLRLSGTSRPPATWWRAINEGLKLRLARAERERDEARAIVDRCAQTVRDHAPNLSVRGGASTPYELSTALQWIETERDEARATCSELRQAVGTIEAAYDRVVSERDTVRSAISRVARTIDEHDTNADMFEWGDEALASVRAVVEEFLRAQGHPVADEWATRRFAIPTAPDVALPCAPAAGAADPLRLSGTSRPPATWWPASDTRTRTR